MCFTVIPIVLLRRHDCGTRPCVTGCVLERFVGQGVLLTGGVTVVGNPPGTQALEWMVNLDRFRYGPRYKVWIVSFHRTRILLSVCISTHSNEGYRGLDDQRRQEQHGVVRLRRQLELQNS